MVFLDDFEQLIPLDCRRFLLAFSGGLDSSVLLKLFAQLREKYQENRPHFASTQSSAITLRAIHIHHGLSPNADTWAAHCERICRQMGIPLIIERVQPEGSQGIEGNARMARYQAIKRHLRENEILVTAHHLNDQTETFLLALKRGSGLSGLGAMQKQSRLFDMPICRPLLNYTRRQLEDFARHEGLDWVEDESNQDNRYERNFLRNQILPRLRDRWPHIDQTVQRSAQHCFEQQQLLNELLQPIYRRHSDCEGRFVLHNFGEYSAAKQTALLRLWLIENQCVLPSTLQLRQFMQDVVYSGPDAVPQFQIEQKIIRRFRQTLYITPKFADLQAIQIPIGLQSDIQLPDNLGCLYIERFVDRIDFKWKTHSVSLPQTRLPVQIRFGYHGKVKTAQNRPSEEIKKIWQALNVPPWERSRIPLIFYGDEFKSAVGFIRVWEGK